MPDRERVIKGLECCSQMAGEVCRECPYANECEEGEGLLAGSAHLAANALALLREQEAVEPTRKVNENGQILSCSNCGAWFIVQKQKYCHECGMAVKWDA